MNIITAKDVAELLKVSEWFVYKHYSVLGGFKIQGVVRFEESLVLEAINERIKDSRQVAVRCDEKRPEIRQERVSDQNRSQSSGSGSHKKNRHDKHGLLTAV